MSYWLVGEAPHPRMNIESGADLCLMPDESVVQHTANMLLRLSGWDVETYLGVFSKRTYLWRHQRRIWLGYGADRAAVIGDVAKRDGSKGVVLVGENVASAFGIRFETPLQWFGIYAVLPHPCSGRFWKTPEGQKSGREFFASLKKGTAP